jgi:hypothetical protein
VACGVALVLGNDQGIWDPASRIAGPMLSVLIFGILGTGLWFTGIGEPANVVAALLGGAVFGVLLIRWLRQGADNS